MCPPQDAEKDRKQGYVFGNHKLSREMDKATRKVPRKIATSFGKAIASACVDQSDSDAD